MNIKENILNELKKVETRIKANAYSQENFVSISDYKNLTEKSSNGEIIWTEALRKALIENENIFIPKADIPYYIDSTVIIPSNRTIKAEDGAVICQTEGTRVLMFRNEHTVDGTHLMPKAQKRDCNITILGGRWEESYRERLGYGESGMYDEERSYYGVSAAMLFNNIENLYISDAVFAHTAGFAVQIGEIDGAVFENIRFDECYADGLHLNGNTENIVIRNISGMVGDDLVALNMYDWQHSSVNFGPMKNVLCETLRPSENSPYKAMRIQPGMYYFDDSTDVDCSAENLIIKDVKGINTYKMYFQTPAYKLGEEPEKGAVGSGDNIFFEDIEVDLKQPMDYMPVYINSDPIRGNFGAFELGANIKNLYFENVRAKLYRDKYPMSGLLSVGPKSAPLGSDSEIFDPYLSSKIENLHYKDIYINSQKIDDIKPYVRISAFNDINKDGRSTAKGEVENYIKED